MVLYYIAYSFDLRPCVGAREEISVRLTMKKLLKKTFHVSVVAVTIMWSIGLAAFVPTVVNATDACPTVTAGSVLKAIVPTGANPKDYTAMWIVTSDLKKMYFPNGDVYKTWFENYKPASRQDLKKQCILDILDATPAGVNFFPGSALIKYPGSDSLYMFEANNKKVEVSVDVAKALFGADYAKYVKTWSDYFATTGSQGTKLTEVKLIDGMLVKKTGGDVYQVVGGKLAKVDGTLPAYIAKNVREVAATLVDGAEKLTTTATAASTYANPAQVTGTGTGTGTGTTPVVVGNLNVALSVATPSAGNVVKAVDNIAFTKVNFTAGSADTLVSAITIGRNGLGSTGDFTSVTLYDGATKLGSTRTSWDSNNQIVFNIPNGWSIKAGETKELTVVGKLGTAGTFNSLGVVAVTAGTATVGGLPVYGNQMSGVTVTVGTVTITNQGTNVSKNIGTTDVTLAQFRLAVDSYENATFKKITLKNKAATLNAADSDFANLYLYKGGVKLAGPVSMVSDKLTFVLDTTVDIDKNKNDDFKVVGDVVDGSTHTAEFVLENTTDLEVIGKTYGTNLSVTNTAYNAASEGMIVTIGGAQLNLAYSGTAIDIKANTNDVVFGTLTLSSGATDAKLTSLILTIDETDASGGTVVLDVDNFEMIETGGGAYSGTIGADGDANADNETWTFDDEIYLTKGQTRTFTLRGDVPASVADGDSYKVIIATVNTTSVVAEIVPGGEAISNFSVGSIDGKLVTVKAPYVTVRPVGQNNFNAVVNQANVVMYKATVEATAGPVTLSRVKFDGVTTTASNTTTFDANLDKTNFSDFGLFIQKADGSYELLQNITNGNMTDGEADFNSFSYTVQPGSANKVNLVFKGTIAATLDSTNRSVFSELTVVTAKDADNNTASVKDASGANVNTGSLKTTGVATLGSTGLLYVAIRNADTGFDKNRVALAGSSYWVGKLRLRADYEAVKVIDLKLTNATADDEDSVDSVCLYKTMSTAADQLIACSTMDEADTVFFDDMNYVVAQGTQDVYVYVTTRAMGSLANSTADTSDAITLSIATSSATNLTARGEASGTDLAYGNTNGAVASGEIVFDLNLDGTFDAATDSGGTASTKTFTIAGSRPNNVQMVSSYGGYTVDTQINGTGEYTAAIFAITNEANSNTNSSGDPLTLTLAALRLDMTKHAASTTFSGATIQRINGAVAAQDLTLTASSTADGSKNGDVWSMATASSTLAADAMIGAGQVAYYVVKATINGLSTVATTQDFDWFKVSLSNLTATASANTNISWYDGYASMTAPGSPFTYLQLDTTSISGTKISE